MEKQIEATKKKYAEKQPTLKVLYFDDDENLHLKCKKCGYSFKRTKKTCRKYQGCPACKNKVLAIGINDMATTASWMIKYLKDKDDSKRFMKSSGKRTVFKCPDCGYEKESKINNIYNFGFSCDLCGDGISRPNKFARALFLQLPVKNLAFEYSSEWTDGKRFDVYFEYDNKKYVVEMDGEQHFKDSEWGKAYRQQINDGVKDLIAIRNGVKIIRIPSFVYDYDGMIKSFIDSPIGGFIEKSNVDWNKCKINAEKNHVKTVCDYYKSHKGITAKDISEIFDISRHTATKYLKIGADVGFCSYTVEEAKEISAKKIKTKRIKQEKEKKLKAIKKLCEYVNNHKNLSYKEIGENIGLNPHTVSKYIKVGIEMGICDYSHEEIRERHLKEAAQKAAIMFGKKVKVYDSENLVGQYNNMKECAETLNKIYLEKYICRDTIRKALVKNNEYFYKGLLFVTV